jgi:hypothetical protein
MDCAPRPAVPPSVGQLATWSDWEPFSAGVATVPRQPGVYLFAVRGQIVYVGMAGERAGRDGQRAPKGLRGRLARYASGRAAASGFGEAVLDRALADGDFLKERLRVLEQQGPERVLEWARAALDHVDAWFCYTTCPTATAAVTLERSVEAELRRLGLEPWNRPRGGRRLG